MEKEKQDTYKYMVLNNTTSQWIYSRFWYIALISHYFYIKTNFFCLVSWPSGITWPYLFIICHCLTWEIFLLTRSVSVSLIPSLRSNHSLWLGILHKIHSILIKKLRNCLVSLIHLRNIYWAQHVPVAVLDAGPTTVIWPSSSPQGSRCLVRETDK